MAPWTNNKQNDRNETPSFCRGKQSILLVLCCLSLIRTFQMMGAQDLLADLQDTEAVNYQAIEGVCPPVPYETRANTHSNEKYCLTTLTDDLLTERWKGKARDFSSLLNKTRPLMEYYATRHGYTFIDQSIIVNATRPTSWFKIQAILKMFREHSCDWVLWVDADVLIMNYTIPLPALIPSDPDKEIIFSPDLMRGVNAGVFLIHNSPWSQDFLTTWWNMNDFIVQKKSSFSGDNDALGSLVRKRWGWEVSARDLRNSRSVLDVIEFSQSDTKIQVTPSMCTMNSWIRFGKEKHRRSRDEWFNHLLYYRKGDFICHLAAINKKDEVIDSFLKEYYS